MKKHSFFLNKMSDDELEVLELPKDFFNFVAIYSDYEDRLLRLFEGIKNPCIQNYRIISLDKKIYNRKHYQMLNSITDISYSLLLNFDDENPEKLIDLLRHYDYCIIFGPCDYKVYKKDNISLLCIYLDAESG